MKLKFVFILQVCVYMRNLAEVHERELEKKKKKKENLDEKKQRKKVCM